MLQVSTRLLLNNVSYVAIPLHFYIPTWTPPWISWDFTFLERWLLTLPSSGMWRRVVWWIMYRRFWETCCLHYQCRLKLLPLQFPADEDRDGRRNVGLLAIQPLDAAASPRIFYWVKLVPLKRRYMSTELQRATFHRTSHLLLNTIHALTAYV